MKRTIIYGFIIGVLFCFNSYCKPSPVSRPNIILLSIDTLRADHLSCYGYPKKTSPAIDRFAKDAVFFEKAISQSSHTAPSHMSLFTALMPDVHQIGNAEELEGENILSSQVPTLAQVLKNQGYLTAAVHGGRSIRKSQGFDRGFELYSETFMETNIDPEKETNIDPEKLPVEMQKAINKSREENKPLFLFVHHYFCHSPYIYGPEAYRQHFLEKKVKNLPVRVEDLSREWVPHDSFWRNVDLCNPEHREHIVSLYDGGVYFSDYLFDEFIKMLKENGYYENSIIILISDHGEEFNERGCHGHGGLFIEHLHVPLIIKFPHHQDGGKSIKEKVRLVDIMPTLLEFLNIPVDFKIQGTSFLSLINKQGEYNPQIVSHSTRVRDGIRFYKDGYVYFKDLNKKIYSGKIIWGRSESLYNFKKDPKEQHNLIEEKSHIMTKMRGIAKVLLAERNRFTDLMPTNSSPVKSDPKLLKQLKAMGYVQ